MIIGIMFVILIILTIVNVLCYFKNAHKETMPTYAAIISLINIIYAIIIAIIVIIYGVTSPTKEESNSSSSGYSTEQTFYYKQTATAINERMFQTEDGNIWIMKNVQLEKNEKYEITFDNHDTEIITDDEIVDFIKLNEKVE